MRKRHVNVNKTKTGMRGRTGEKIKITKKEKEKYNEKRNKSQEFKKTSQGMEWT